MIDVDIPTKTKKTLWRDKTDDLSNIYKRDDFWKGADDCSLWRSRVSSARIEVRLCWVMSGYIY